MTKPAGKADCIHPYNCFKDPDPTSLLPSTLEPQPDAQWFDALSRFDSIDSTGQAQLNDDLDDMIRDMSSVPAPLPTVQVGGGVAGVGCVCVCVDQWVGGKKAVQFGGLVTCQLCVYPSLILLRRACTGLLLSTDRPCIIDPAAAPITPQTPTPDTSNPNLNPNPNPQEAGPHVPDPPLAMADREFIFIPVPPEVRAVHVLHWPLRAVHALLVRG